MKRPAGHNADIPRMFGEIAGMHRRGWLEQSDVLNTRPLAELQTLLRRVPIPAMA